MMSILHIPFLSASERGDLELYGVVGVQREKGGVGFLFEPSPGFSLVVEKVTVDDVPIYLCALLHGGRIR